VGPWVGPWPSEDRYDPDLLTNGDNRNVVDRYRYWRLEAIVADLDRRRHPFHVAIENWQHDLNIGSVVRTANAFLAAEVHIVGRRRWNRRGAMTLPARCALVFGQEGPGLTEGMRSVCRSTLSIAQFGSTRSINAGAAAAIAMHTWVRQHAAHDLR
jgi:tRNA G18 (ribose-2'-O)-methylase SpoU